MDPSTAKRLRFLSACSIAVLTGCGLPNTSTASATAPAIRQRIAWTSCYEPAKQLECARVAVPLDWKRRDGTQIELAVIRHRASRPGERIGSLFFNWGGPGVAGIPIVRSSAEGLDKIGGGRFDVVSWDPRGTGQSEPIVCFNNAESRKTFYGRNWSIPTTPAESSKYVPKTIAFIKACTSRNAALLAHVSTADTARDLDYLRQLVGDAALNFHGISYGTMIGQTYANMFPRRVRAMVLDGVVDPIAFTDGTAASTAKGISDADLVFEKFQSLCQSAGATRCALAGRGAVAPRVSRLLASLRRAPIGKLTYGDALIVLWVRLGAPDRWPELASVLEKAARGDGSALEADAREGKEFLEPALDSAVALQCADKDFPPRPVLQSWPRTIGALSDESFISGPVNGWLLWAPCASWPVRSAGRYSGPWNANTKNPILVIGTRFDPNTAFDNAVGAAARLGNAVLLTHDGYGHTSGSDPSTCVERAVSKYLVGLATPPQGTVCRSDRLPFDPI